MLFKQSQIRTNLLVFALILMLGSVALAEMVKPRKYWADVIGEPHYSTLIPHQFGDWQAIPNGGKAMVNPVQEENLMRLYSETFARSYVNTRTKRIIMLSIAYGRDQSNDTQLHTPEACYPSQGFRVESRTEHTVASKFGPLESVRLMTTMGTRRTEPLTFFVRVGDEVARGSRDRNLARIKMAFKGYRVDGMLFRVSEVTKRDGAYELQDQFISDLLSALSPEGRRRVIGSVGT
ncbi:exosortase C-terminal domain/associated protein EpsI [Aquabacterium sp.]|uniref:exosortase C-terminal domain/associated protein EpsI n=1 Tax=Aquabacterium sp. TaxID=1872578 RepID=UPI0019A82D22|nr:exosortase C-terminal domain/associated protein EpsI [Aquabacterium sp.]MBC7701831.1 EpsI family protein [Aquabacterium sp.]